MKSINQVLQIECQFYEMITVFKWNEIFLIKNNKKYEYLKRCIMNMLHMFIYFQINATCNSRYTENHFTFFWSNKQKKISVAIVWKWECFDCDVWCENDEGQKTLAMLNMYKMKMYAWEWRLKNEMRMLWTRWIQVSSYDVRVDMLCIQCHREKF